MDTIGGCKQMEGPRAEVEGLSIVLRGHFNPAIVTHGWLLAQKLLSVDDFTETRPDLITSDVSSFQTPWFNCHVTSDMLQVSTSEPAEMEVVRDIVVGILRALPHTPIGVMGINHDFHFRVDDVAQWHAIGDALAPKAPWGESLRLPGMLSVHMLSVRDDDQAGQVRTAVEPSARIRPHGVYVAYNDHFSLKAASSSPASRDEAEENILDAEQRVEPTSEKGLVAIDLLAAHWKPSFESAHNVLRQIRSLAKAAQ